MNDNPRDQLIRDFGLLLTGALHPAAALGPTARHAACRLRDALGLDADAGSGVRGADTVAAVIAAALDDPSRIAVPAFTGPVPPAEVLARRITHADVQRWPAFFITGPGRDIADRTPCGHGYMLTASCPSCP